MSKFGVVYRNELYKIFKRKVYIAFVIVMSVVVLVCGILAGQKYARTSTLTVDFEYSEEKHTELNDAIDTRRDVLDVYEQFVIDNENFVPDDSVGVQFTQNAYLYALAQSELWQYEMRERYSLKYENDYRAEIIEIMAEFKARIACYEYVSKYTLADTHYSWYTYNTKVYIWSQEDCANLNAKLDYYGELLQNEDFTGYIETRINEIRTLLVDIPEISEMAGAHYKATLAQLEYRLQGNITGERAAHSVFFDDVAQLQKYNESVSTQMKNTSYMYSPGELEELQNQIAILEYKMEHHCYDSTLSLITENGIDVNITLAKQLFDIAGIIFTVMIIMIAASSISRELETGSVKLLLVSPVKRWKVLLAKISAIMSVAMLALLWLALCVILSIGLTLGFNSFCPYIFVTNGVAHGIPFVLFVLLYVLLMGVSALWYTVLAVQLSCIIKNTAFATMSSLILYMLDFVGTAFVALYVNASWLQYVPTVCVSRLVKTVFANGGTGFDMLNFFAKGTELLTGLDPLIMAAIIISLTVAVLLTALDSFCRRDIK